MIGGRERTLRSAPPDPKAMHRRLDEALLKEMLGDPLSERELRIVQWIRNGEGCAACNSRTAAAVIQPYGYATHRGDDE